MKKIVLTVLFCMVLAATAMAQYTGPSGAKATVKEALDMADDTYVTLTGKITKHIGGNKYSFTDETGTIEVEIKNRMWNGFTAGPDDTVVIVGKIDKDFFDREVEVKSIGR